MTVGELANLVIEACEAEGVEHMVTGAFAFNLYGIPRSTGDVDLVANVSSEHPIGKIISRLYPEIEFGAQIQLDTLTWERRHIGTPKSDSALQAELFELFDDPFVQEQFRRRQRLFSAQLQRHTWLPTAEDIVVQKLRWARPKDLDDARDILAVQGPETLDMAYIEHWCTTHRTTSRLDGILKSLPEF